jgi:hypothetical protein
MSDLKFMKNSYGVVVPPVALLAALWVQLRGWKKMEREKKEKLKKFFKSGTCLLHSLHFNATYNDE